MSTFLELTNLLLRRLLEAELTQSSFASARATQATAKDCIKDAVNEIYAKDKRWPFLYGSGTQTLTAGQEEYALPADCETPDWKSFKINQSTPLGVQTTTLELIDRDVWFKFYRPDDEDSSTTGLGIPKYVFNSDSTGEPAFGITPSPDAAYTVAFQYYKFVSQLSAHSDTVLIPERYNFVILSGALKYFFSFKDNVEQTNIWETRFKNGISTMRDNLIDRQDVMKDTRVNFGGLDLRSGFSTF